MRRDPSIGHYLCHPPEYRDYDPVAVEVARLVSLRILAHLPMVAVEHIGSTAVPDCAGKGIVDLVLVYPAERLEIAKALLADLGFQPQRAGHLFPETRPMRVGAVDHDGKTYRLHVHVVAESSPEVQGMCTFRDRLRIDAALRAAYAELKRAIIEAGVLDPAAYTQMKASFIQRALAPPRRKGKSAGVRVGASSQERVQDAIPGT